MFKNLSKVFIGFCVTWAGAVAASPINLQPFENPERGHELLRQYNYAMASVDRGVAKEAQKVLEDILPQVTYDRRLYGYTRIALTHFQMGRVADAQALMQRIVNALRGESNDAVNKINLAAAYTDARRYDRADRTLEELSYECGADRKEMLREINIARATIAVGQYDKAAIQIRKIATLLERENREQLDSFEFSLDSFTFDTFAGASSH